MNFLDGGGDLGVGLAAHQRHVREAFVGQDPVEHSHHVILEGHHIINVHKKCVLHIYSLLIFFCFKEWWVLDIWKYMIYLQMFIVHMHIYMQMLLPLETVSQFDLWYISSQIGNFDVFKAFDYIDKNQFQDISWDICVQGSANSCCALHMYIIVQHR